MLFALGAASTAFDAIKSLTSSKLAKSSPALGQASANPFSVSAADAAPANSAVSTGFSGGARISPATFSALLEAQSQSSTNGAAQTPASRASALQDLFSRIDGDGNGQITKSEFEDALGAGGTNTAQADHVFGELDKDGDGSVSLGELSSALHGGGHGGHHHHFNADAAANSIKLSSLSQSDSSTTGASDGSSSSSSSSDDRNNSDGKGLVHQLPLTLFHPLPIDAVTPLSASVHSASPDALARLNVAWFGRTS
jgi:hypothetical protein